MKCGLCTKEIKPNKHTFKRELKYRKHMIHNVIHEGSMFEDIFSFIKRTLFKKIIEEKYTTTKNIYDYYLLCSLCKTKTYVCRNEKPYWSGFSASVIVPEGWKLVKI